jgi:colanic acid/amylovoran biosynthesis glycosyltransferase
MSLAYIFERFPAPTQTFCVREVGELLQRAKAFPIFSIRRDAEAASVPLPPHVASQLASLPSHEELKAYYEAEKKLNRLPQAAVLTIRHWGERPDKERCYEAIWLGEQLQRQGIRHVHCHFAGLAARTCWWLRQLYGIRYSFTAHANDVFCQDESHVTLAHTMAGAEMVVTVSEFTAQWLRERFPACAGKIRVVYNGLEMQPIADATIGVQKAQPPLIASVGRLIEKKGFDDLITACGVLKDRGIAFQCEIIGAGPDEAMLKEQVQQLALSPYVRLLGSQGQPKVRELLGRASIFALPCVTEKSGGMDNLPTVLMEAMAARLPCASTFLAGVPEMVENNVTGLLCGERQPEAFAELLAQLLQSPSRRLQMGQAGWERAQRLFAKDRTIPRLLAAFQEAGALPGNYPFAARLRHWGQKKTPKARCEPISGGGVQWIA